MRPTIHRLLLYFAVLSTTAAAQSVVRGLPSGGSAGLNRQAIAARQAAQSPKTSRRGVAVFPGDNIIPQLVEGAGWSTAMTFVNLDVKSVRFTIYFLDDNGDDLAIPVTGIGTTAGVDITLPVNNTITVQTPGTSASLKQGWVYIERGIDDIVSGLAVFRQRVSGRPDFEAVVPIVSEFDDRFVLLYDNTNGFTTAVAIANPSVAAVRIPITVRDEDGNVLETRTTSLDGLAHIAGSIPDTWPVTRGRRGSIEFRTNNLGVGVLGLRFNPSGAFTSFHVLSNIDWILN